MRYVYIEMRGAIPGSLLELLRLEYGSRVIIRAEGLERMRDVLVAPLYEREPEKMKPGDFLRFYRQQGGLTQAALGKALGGVRPQNIGGLADYFGVAASRFLP